MSNRKLVYYVATSIDHYIAHKDGSTDGFLTGGQHVTDYFHDLTAYDAVLMGKNTYEYGYRYGVQPGQPSPAYPHMQQYVFSQTMNLYQHPQLHIVRDEPSAFVRALKAEQGRAIYLCGGGALAGYLLDAELIDEVILKINPIHFGEGIGLFGHSIKKTPLNLLATKTYQNGVIFAHYTLHNV
jgi:dihydrofolate reductase